MDPNYDPQKIESKWQKRWAEQRLFEAEAEPGRKKYYVLEMLPYPSGEHPHGPRAQLHRSATRWPATCGWRVQRPAPDRLGRLRPAGGERRHQAQQCIPRSGRLEHRRMNGQLKRLGSATTGARDGHLPARILPLEPVVLPQDVRARPGLPQDAAVNWCPECQTVLANEQVYDGCAGATRTPRGRATNSSSGSSRSPTTPSRLLDDMKPARLAGARAARCSELDRRSRGAPGRLPGGRRSTSRLRIFTTRLDTLYGVTFMLLAPEHPMVARLAAGTGPEAAVAEFVNVAREDRFMRAARGRGRRKASSRAATPRTRSTGARVPI